MTRMSIDGWNGFVSASRAFARLAALWLIATIIFATASISGSAITAQETNETQNAPTPIKPRSISIEPATPNPIIIDPANLEPLILANDPNLTPNYLGGFVPPETPIELVDFRDQELGQAMRLFSEQSGINIVASTNANTMKVNLYLRDVRPMDVLENLTKTHDLYFRIDEKSGVIRIYTTDEYEENLASFREEQTKVFTLLYPNPVDAAVAIRDLFGDRVQLSFGVGDQDSILDIINRLNRFDLVDSRSLGLGAYQGDYAYGGRSFSRLDGLGGFTNEQNNKGSSQRSAKESQPLSDLSSEQIQKLIDAINNRSTVPRNDGTTQVDPISKLLKEKTSHHLRDCGAPQQPGRCQNGR